MNFVNNHQNFTFFFRLPILASKYDEFSSLFLILFYNLSIYRASYKPKKVIKLNCVSTL